MKRLTIAIPLLFTILTGSGQEISKPEAELLLLSLSKPVSDMDRMDILLKLAAYQVFKPGENKVDFDSATAYINQVVALNKSVKSPAIDGYRVLVASYMLREKGQRDTAKQMAEKAVGMLATGSNKTYLGKALYDLSGYYDFRNNDQLATKIALVEQAVAAFQQAENIKLTAFSLRMLADLYNLRGFSQKAMEAIKSSLRAYESIHYTELQSVYALVGKIYVTQGDYKEALAYELKALQTAESLGDSTMQLSEIYNVLGSIYTALDKNDLAVEQYKKAFDIAVRNNDYSVFHLILNLAYEFLEKGRPQYALQFLASLPKKYREPADPEAQQIMVDFYLKTYIYLKQPDRAKPYCDKLVSIINHRTINDPDLHSMYRTLARYYMLTGQFVLSRKYLTENIAVANRMGSPRGKAFDARAWFQLDSSEGNYKSAIGHLQRHHNITDSLFNENKAKQVERLQVEYETTKKADSIKLKDKDILLLTEKTNLQQANLNRVRVVRNATIAGIILATIIIALLYRQYRHKQQSNEVISGKNQQLQHLLTEKEWLLKEIHHRVKNNFQTVMGLLRIQAGYQTNDVAATAINDSQRRIQSMSLIHQKLYQSNNLSAVNMPDYVHELVDSLNESFNTGGRIRFNLSIEPMELDLAHCIPLGLILNEALPILATG